MPQRRSSKGLRLFTILGLPVTLSAGIMAMYLWVNNKANPINQAVILLSPWRNLRPYIIAQAKLESENFNSNIYRKTNNPLAMGHARKRKQLGDPQASDVFERGSTLSIQKYRNDTQGFRDMFLWFEQFQNPPFPRSVPNAASYVRELKKRHYFGLDEALYLKGVEHWLNK